jgi:hypothetical protein
MNTNTSRMRIMAEAMANTTIKMVFLNMSPPSPKLQGVVVGWMVVGSSPVVLESFATSAKSTKFNYAHIRRY